MAKASKIEQLTIFNRPEESPGFLLWHISLSWRSSIEKVLKSLELTHPQFVVLATTAWLTKNGERISQSAIGKACGLDPNTTSQILRGLEAKKLIQRNQVLDERSKNPQLTATGAKVLAKALPAVEIEDAQFFSALNPSEIGSLVKIFQKITSKR